MSRSYTKTACFSESEQIRVRKGLWLSAFSCAQVFAPFGAFVCTSDSALDALHLGSMCVRCRCRGGDNVSQEEELS